MEFLKKFFAFDLLLKDEDNLVRSTGRYALILTIIITIVSFPIFGWEFSATFFSGAVIMLLNFVWMKELINILTKRAEKGKMNPRSAVKFLLRYLLLGIFLYVIISLREVSVLALLLGLSILVMAIFCVSIKMIFNFTEN